MIVKKIRTTYADVKVKGITLLSAQEYEKAKDYIPLLNDWWWLRSPGTADNCATYVDAKGSLNKNGHDVGYGSLAVRPAIKIASAENSDVKAGDKIEFAGNTWTVIPGEMMVCDDIISHHRFARKENSFMISDVRIYIENWLADRLV